MASRPVHLLTSRASSAQRKHFGIFIPSARDPQIGTVIQVVGAPMAGYQLEFKRNFNPSTGQPPHTSTLIGHVAVGRIACEGNKHSHPTIDNTPGGDMEMLAAQISPPPISQNFLAPVDGVINRRCQEWTVEYVNQLISKGYIEVEARDIVQSLRDPPAHGVGLRAINEG